ncbi:heterokaryon incompatibility domain-containing protein [Trichoderma evansii]
MGECSNDDEMYVNADHLLVHMRTKHSSTKWTCNPCSINTKQASKSDQPNPQVLVFFDSAESWQAHTEKEHGNLGPAPQRDILTELSKRQLIGPLECPLSILNKPIYIDVVSSKFPANRKQRRIHGSKQGFAVIRRPHEMPYNFTAQEVPTYFNPAVAKEWIRYCREHHWKTCYSQQDASVINLNLIDCESLIVERGHPQALYVALNYVWGSSTAYGQYALEVTSDGTLYLPSVLPPVILDAIAFCIDQVNKDMKHEQIRQMDSIYENAVVTIIAAAGFDETYGLPGVMSKQRHPQPIARMEGLTILSTMRDIHDSIRSSKWFTGGWTFQEALLSRRRLVFTDEQSLSGSINALREKYGLDFPRYLKAGMFERHSWHNVTGSISGPEVTLDSFLRYLTAVEDYTPRELRYQHDSLNAFAGVIKKFEKAYDPIIQLWGIPTTIKHGDATKRCFAHALCWGHAYSCWDGPLRPCRRPDFPSWPWAGWAGEVNYAKNAGSDRILPQSPKGELSRWTSLIWNTAVDVKVSFEDEAGQILRLNEMEKLIPTDRFDVAFARVLRLEARVFPSSSFSYDEKSGWKLFGHPAVMSLSQGPDSQSQFLEQLNEKDSDLQCIHIGDADTNIFGLILETRGGVSSRVGLFIANWNAHKKFNYGLFKRSTFRIQ